MSVAWTPLSATEKKVYRISDKIKIEDNNSKLLMRYEFFEAILRIAGLMYKDTKITQTFAEAF